MASQYPGSYSDPYAHQQQQQQQYSSYADAPASYDQPYGCHDGNNVQYGEEPRYPSYPSDPSAGEYHTMSTEKVADDGQLDHGTQRAQPGRAGLRQPPTTSFAELGPPPRSTGILRVWRKDERGRQWSRGGGVRMSLRLCCCCATIALIMVVSIILSVLLYVRPPSVALNSVTVGSDPVSLTTDGLTISFDLSISVANPNWFDADFEEIVATARYPGNNTNSFGGGSLYDLDFKGFTESTFDFPFTLNYTLAKDPDKVILNDLISKCGISGGTVEDITIDYDLYLKLKILGVTVSPTVSSSASFECPITEDDIESIIGSS